MIRIITMEGRKWVCHCGAMGTFYSNQRDISYVEFIVSLNISELTRCRGFSYGRSCTTCSKEFAFNLILNIWSQLSGRFVAAVITVAGNRSSGVKIVVHLSKPNF